jgi:hypothetical protein
MATIDRLDIAVNFQYARRIEFVEAIQKELHLERSTAVSDQALVVDLFPKRSEVELLLGLTQTRAPWAYFYAPPSFQTQRQSTFAFFRIAPTMGSLAKQEADAKKVATTQVHSKEEVEEQGVLGQFFSSVNDINEMIGFVTGRIGEFLKG